MTKPDFKIFEETIDTLQYSKSIQDVLVCLQPFMSLLSMSSLRYYRYSPTTRVLTSIDALDQNSDELTDYLRLGEFKRNRDDKGNHLENSETFWAIRLERPVLFVLTEEAGEKIKPEKTTQGPVTIRLRESSCDEPLLSLAKTQYWIDFPLMIGGVPVGKFSCDLSSDPTTSAKDIKNFSLNVKRFNTLVQIVAPHLEHWVHYGLGFPLEVAGNLLRDATNRKEVLEVVVNELKSGDFFDCRNVDFLSMVKDDNGRDALILEATSRERSKEHIGKRQYSFDSGASPTLSQYSVETKKSLRFINLYDSPGLDSQIEYYFEQFGLKKPLWNRSNHVSNTYWSLMFIPVLDPSDSSKAIGLLRFADKRRDEYGYGGKGPFVEFSSYDQRLAEQIAYAHLAPALVSSQQREFEDCIANGFPQILEIESNTNPESLRELTRTLFESLPERFQDSSRKKLICLSRLDNPMAPNNYHLIALHGNHSDIPQNFEGPYRLDRSLTDSIRKDLKAKYFHDIEFATQSAGNFNSDVLPDVASAVACPITTKGIVFGALIILSSHCDLEGGDMIKKVFKVFSASLGRLLFDEEAGSVNQTVSGFRHDIQPIINNLQDEAGRILEIDDLSNTTKRIGNEIETTANLLASIVEAQCRYRVDLSEQFNSDEFCEAEIKKEIQMIWDLISKKRQLKFGKGFTRKIQHVHFTTFQAVIWNLLRNCFAHSPVNTSINVEGTSENGYLKLEFRNKVLPHFDGGHVKKVVEKARYDLTMQTASQEKYPPISGLANVTRLLRWTPKVKQKEAKLDFDYENEECFFTVFLPTINN